MAAGAASVKKVLWLVFGLIACVRSLPVPTDAVQEEVSVEGVPQDVLSHDEHLQDIREFTNPISDQMKTVLEGVIRHGRELQAQVGRQSAATMATSLGDLFRPAITAFIGALTMNSAASITNAITALFGGRSLDLIPAETFMTAPVGRENSVVQPTRMEVKQRRHLRRKQRPTIHSLAH